MKEHPILFNGDMVRAILEGRKTQTRRPIVPQPTQIDGDWYLKLNRKVIGMPNQRAIIPEALSILDACPFSQPGDRLWVRETFATSIYWDDKPLNLAETPGNGYGWPVWYRDGSINLRGAKALDGGPGFTTKGKWRPSIHMPSWASRITLEVTGVRVERVQDISEQDAKAEGMERLVYGVDHDAETGYKPVPYVRSIDDEGDERLASCKNDFHFTWDGIYSKRGLGWDANPWVWVVDFRIVENS